MALKTETPGVLRMAMISALDGVPITIVDDARTQQSLLAGLLRVKGCAVVCFDDGQQFLDYYGASTENLPVIPAIVFMDLLMPVKDGYATIIEALQMECFRDTIFVCVSSKARDEDWIWLRNSGFHYYAPKPIREDVAILAQGLLANKDEVLSGRLLLESSIIAEETVAELARLRLRTFELEDKYIKRLVSPEVFEALQTAPDSLEPRDLEVAIGFVDIRGFTNLSNQVQTRQLTQILNLFFEHVILCVKNHGGFIDKFIGDQVMWFHRSASLEDSADKCFETAFAIIRGLEGLNQRIQDALHLKISIEIGVGCACGLGAVGIFGAPTERIQYSVIGPPVNLAARLCSEARAGELMIGGALISFCKYPSDRVGFRAFKGFDLEVELRTVEVPPEVVIEVPAEESTSLWNSPNNADR